MRNSPFIMPNTFLLTNTDLNYVPISTSKGKVPVDYYSKIFKFKVSVLPTKCFTIFELKISFLKISTLKHHTTIRCSNFRNNIKYLKTYLIFVMCHLA